MSHRSVALRLPLRRVAVAALVCVGASSGGCGSDSMDTGEPACLSQAPNLDCTPLYGLVNGQIEPTFDELWQRTLHPTCGVEGCHAAPNPKNGLALDVEDTAYTNLLGKSSTGEPRVTPGDINCGKFMVRLETTGEAWSMPPGRHLDDTELCVIRHWVKNGAKR